MVGCDDCHPGTNAAAWTAYADVIFQYHYGRRLGIPNTQDDFDAASVRLPGEQTACEIQLDQTVTGRIDHNGLLANRYSGAVRVPGDRDWFKIDLTGGVRYRIEVETRSHGMHNPGLGGIYNSGGTKVHNGNGSRGNSAYSERIHFKPTGTGTARYFIEVSAGSSGPFNTGRYWLTITEAP